MKTYYIDSYILKVGSNKEDNQELVEDSDKNHTWFHLSDYPSCHGVINCSLDSIYSTLIYKCACKIKKNSKYSSEINVSIDYTKIGNLKLTTNVGEVKYTKKPNKLKV